MKLSRIFIYVLIFVSINGESLFAASGEKWDIKTNNKIYQNVDVLSIEGDTLKIADRKGNAQFVPIQDIVKIQKMTLVKNVFYGGCGAYLGGVAGAFIGWPLFPKWGHDDGHMNGYQSVMILGGLAGVIYRKQVVGIGKNLLERKLGFPIGRPGMERWSVARKKEWIKSNIFYQSNHSTIQTFNQLTHLKSLTK